MHSSDFSDDKSEFVYSWICPRNSVDCEDTDDTTKVSEISTDCLLTLSRTDLY
jgi:hypothetical protein